MSLLPHVHFTQKEIEDGIHEIRGHFLRCQCFRYVMKKDLGQTWRNVVAYAEEEIQTILIEKACC